ncbi:MAG: HmuY family protein [Chitinophagaceae bacterium]|nr:HmuY family protein [Chitinophagaceae bacterium]
MLKRISSTLLFVYLFAAPFFVAAQDVKNTDNLNASQAVAYFNLSTGKEVTDPDPKNWDISFQKTTISVNGSAQVVNIAFEGLSQPPSGGFKTDDGNNKAIPTGSGNGWYNYNMEDHTIEPIANRTIVIKTPKGKYYKLQIISYNKNRQPHEPTGYYSFRYKELGKGK